MGSTNKPWKVFERITAKFFGGKRIVPSDDRSQGDVLHDFLYVECKCYLGAKTKPSVVTLYDKTAERAKVEGKVPVVCLKRKGTELGFLVVVAAKDLEAAYLALRQRINDEKFEKGEDDGSE